ncbi:sugar nucleotide-binding protein [Candidatus Saccharibacteria bacterium]|nr:sugar nucleotide-binding protein [Candidatus Saccharibacteria bacterium]
MKASESPIKGLFVVDLDLHEDDRGWFKENWQNAKAVGLGLPKLSPVQNNISFNHFLGVTRGFHAEPWNKYVSVTSGKVFAAWVDLRKGDGFGQTFSTEITPGQAVYVPKGVANSYQSLEDNTVYTYLVDGYYEPSLKYSAVSLFDESIDVKWPIPLSEAIVSDKDKTQNPLLKDVEPLELSKIIIIGANGQLGSELHARYPDATALDFPDIDITSNESLGKINWSEYSTIINAAAMTDVDGAETDNGRTKAWAINSTGVANLASIANKYGLTLVHISSDYVFDGKTPNHTETESFSPLGVYGQTKAAGDIAASLAPNHYILRTSWVVGNGKNFIRTMFELGQKGVSPKVVSDQTGRLTFVDELARAIAFLLDNKPAYGTYNLTNDGKVASWADIASRVFEIGGFDAKVIPTSTAEYIGDKTGISPRPEHSDLDLTKIHTAGFNSTDYNERMEEYIRKELL